MDSLAPIFQKLAKSGADGQDDNDSFLNSDDHHSYTKDELSSILKKTNAKNHQGRKKQKGPRTERNWAARAKSLAKSKIETNKRSEVSSGKKPSSMVNGAMGNFQQRL